MSTSEISDLGRRIDAAMDLLRDLRKLEGSALVRQIRALEEEREAFREQATIEAAARVEAEKRTSELEELLAERRSEEVG